jgi:hypothetical protein
MFGWGQKEAKAAVFCVKKTSPPPVPRAAKRGTAGGVPFLPDKWFAAKWLY